MAELSYGALRKAQLEERSDPGNLKRLPPDYFDAYSAYLKRMRECLSGEYSLEDARAFENSALVFNGLFESRKKKIVLKALKEAANGSLDGEGLTSQERDFYGRLVEIFRDYDGERAVASCKPAQAAAGSESIRILMDLPQFVGSDNASYGPYARGQEVELPEKIAAFLYKRNAAEKR